MDVVDSDDNKSELRQLDSIRRGRDSVLRLLNQARMKSISQQLENLVQEFDKLDAALSGDDESY
ncbi:MAG: hypothetical protein P8Q96_01395 [Candidatus Thalassarchaeaceae archaeon]|jgi:hypothetical protein|nr:hypothetical protein [Euryarchaeota archaeon]MDG1548363.1 hypothetical protein [Candidatus Thalassarchaeaceae archaeon]MBT3847391.1 hypothetical protein [Euryarchaeota archaeon]MBT4180494.1 hypothetical protein [Euryarchaeota archaeon]MBT4474931.1 hypothetical protein [Euryarchaeota archaeon]